MLDIRIKLQVSQIRAMLELGRFFHQLPKPQHILMNPQAEKKQGRFLTASKYGSLFNIFD
jgi:hypothetical protein